MAVFIVREFTVPLAAYASQAEAVAYAEGVANTPPTGYRFSSATRHLVVETWDGPATDWRDDVHVYAKR